MNITFTANLLSFSWEGELVKIKHTKKRIWGEVVKEERGSEIWEDEIAPSPTTTLTIKPVYRPAPKSTLNKKNVFSKFKKKIIPLTNHQQSKRHE